jgi:hypothetical protein
MVKNSSCNNSVFVICKEVHWESWIAWMVSEKYDNQTYVCIFLNKETRLIIILCWNHSCSSWFSMGFLANYKHINNGKNNTFCNIGLLENDANKICKASLQNNPRRDNRCQCYKEFTGVRNGCNKLYYKNYIVVQNKSS